METDFLFHQIFTQALMDLVEAFDNHDQATLGNLVKQPLDIHQYLNVHSKTARLDFLTHSVSEDRKDIGADYNGIIDLIVTDGKNKTTYPTDVQISLRLESPGVQIVSLKKHNGKI
uniref:Type I site-specific deoxyribonuclease n=2 Tax=Caenorhabditis tropicalis TaxID=1561998 RepID=A0A1I7UEZ1_9PELO